MEPNPTNDAEPVDSSADAGVTFEQLEAALQADLHAEHTGRPVERETQQQDEDSASPSDESPDPNDSPETADPSEGRDTVTVAELAARLNVEAADIYNELAIDVGDGTSMTLSEFKDRAKDLHRADQVLIEATEQKQTIERELLQKRQQIEAEAQGLTPEQLQERQQQWVELQKRTFAEMSPDMANPETAQQFDKRLAQTISEMGFGAEASVITSAMDARFKLFFKQHFEMQDVIEQAKKSVRKSKQAGPKPHTSTGNKVTRLRDAIKSGQVSQNDAISDLAKLL